MVVRIQVAHIKGKKKDSKSCKHVYTYIQYNESQQSIISLKQKHKGYVMRSLSFAVVNLSYTYPHNSSKEKKKSS